MKKLKLIFIFLSLFLVAFVFYLKNSSKNAPPFSLAPKSDLSSHPVYSTYKFSVNEKRINIGIQPLYLPTGIIIETMRRDWLLYESLKKEGYDIKYYPFLKGDDVNYFLKRGDLAAGIGGDMPAITAAATYDIVVVSLIQDGFTSIVSNSSMLIKELKTRHIGYAFGSNAHYMLLNALESSGLNENDVKLIPMEVTDMPSALASGKIEAFAAWEPVPSTTVNENRQSIVIHRGLSTGYLYFSKIFERKHSEALRLILAAKIRAINWLINDRNHLLTGSSWALRSIHSLAVSDFKKLTPELNAELALKDILGYKTAPHIPENTLKNDGALFNEYLFLKRIGKIPPYSEWEKIGNSFTNKYYREVMSQRTKYKIDVFKYREIVENKSEKIQSSEVLK